MDLFLHVQERMRLDTDRASATEAHLQAQLSMLQTTLDSETSKRWVCIWAWCRQHWTAQQARDQRTTEYSAALVSILQVTLGSEVRVQLSMLLRTLDSTTSRSWPATKNAANCRPEASQARVEVAREQAS